jgi:S-DNA-T family DNA segregation ATPase FtsK/SpoIIIE
MDILMRPGEFLFLCFSFAAIYVPAYLFTCSYLAVSRPYQFRKIQLLMFTIIPFLTASIVLGLGAGGTSVTSPLALVIERTTGRFAGVLIFSVLLVLESVILYKFAVKYKVEKTEAKKEKERILSSRVIHDTNPGNPKREFILNENRKNRRYEPSLEEMVNPDDPLFKPVLSEKKPVEPQKIQQVKIKKPKKIKGILPGSENAQKALMEPDVLYIDSIASDAETGIVPVPAGIDGEAETLLAVDEPIMDAEEPVKAMEDGAAAEKTPSLTKVEKLQNLIAQMKASQKKPKAGEVPVPRKDTPEKAKAGQKRTGDYFVPVEGLLHDYETPDFWTIDDETRRDGAILMETLEEFKINAGVTGIQKGPVITMFEILPAPGVKLSRIVNLADNIALRLAASRVRIVAPIPGKHAVGIEIPNKRRAIVSFKELITDEEMDNPKYEIPIVIGKDIMGGHNFIDLVQTPHFLIAGATGSGKSVCVNSIICSILYKRTPEQVKLLLIDPKIVELKFYNGIPHLFTPVVTDPKRAFLALL